MTNTKVVFPKKGSSTKRKLIMLLNQKASKLIKAIGKIDLSEAEEEAEEATEVDTAATDLNKKALEEAEAVREAAEVAQEAEVELTLNLNTKSRVLQIL